MSSEIIKIEQELEEVTRKLESGTYWFAEEVGRDERRRKELKNDWRNLMETKITIQQAAEILKVSQPRVIKMLYDGKFGPLENQTKFGKNWQLDEAAVMAVRDNLAIDSRSNLFREKSLSQPIIRRDSRSRSVK